MSAKIFINMTDPITRFLNSILWVFWVMLWVSLAIGFGQNIAPLETVNHGHEIVATISSILLWGAVVIQIIKQLYYTNNANIMLNIGRWLLLISSSIFAFRMSYMLILYGTVPISFIVVLASIFLAVGLILSSLGVMMNSDLFNNGDVLNSK